MNALKDIQGVIFDYGGTIDTNSRHWAEVLWAKYVEHQIPVDKESFREAYVFGERALAKYPFVQPWHDFHDVLSIKAKLQMEWLAEQRKLPMDELKLQSYATKVADSCYEYVLDILQVTRPVVEELSKKYKLVLVSNFYGNIQTILRILDFWISLMKLLNPLWWVFVNQIPLSTDSEWMLWDLWQRMCWWLEILSQKMLFLPKRWDVV